ncbi:MAG: ABC transporter permease [Candidatus Bathyarchaeota archaeon]|nr:ABC transporter permease [Candidatus Bathyarchaeota archaeon]
MSMINFRYLSRKRVFALIVILTLASVLFSVTAYSFLGFYNGFTNYVGEEDDVVAVYSKVGSTPFTGIMPLSLADNISAVNGVVTVSPEVIAPCTITEQSVFVRGIIPEQLKNLNQLTILTGQNLSLTDTNSALVGKNLADRLRLQVGDRLLVFGVLSKHYLELQVLGVFQSDSALNDEVLVPIYAGQWLRGLSYNYATLIRAKLDLNQITTTQLYQELTSQNKPQTTPSPSASPSSTQQSLQAILPLLRANVDVGVIGVEQSQTFMQNYLDRYGISKDALIVLSMSVFVFASGVSTCAITLFVRQHTANIAVLRSIGATERKMRVDLTLKMIFWALLATLLGTAVSVVVIMLFQSTGYLQVLSHIITFQFNPVIVVANFMLLFLIIGINMARMELKQ